MPCSSEDAPQHICVRESLAKLDGYTCLAGPSVDKVLLPVQYRTGDLAWVLKSKGRKVRGTAPDAPNNDDANNAQRYELFLRGRIIDNPHASSSSSSATTGTTIDKDDDKDHATTTTTFSDKDNNIDRLWIQYPKGSTYHVKRKNLVRILQRRGGLILVWPETDVYRRGCLTHTLPVSEGFVEIGCDHGLTVDRVASSLTTTPSSSSAAAAAAAVLGIDKADDSIASARRRYPQYTFVQWDCLQPDAVVPPELHELIQANESFHLAIDIGGNRDLPAVLQCLHRLLVDFRLKPRLVFVKSRALFQELQAQRGE